MLLLFHYHCCLFAHIGYIMHLYQPTRQCHIFFSHRHGYPPTLTHISFPPVTSSHSSNIFDPSSCRGHLPRSFAPFPTLYSFPSLLFCFFFLFSCLPGLSLRPRQGCHSSRIHSTIQTPLTVFIHSYSGHSLLLFSLYIRSGPAPSFYPLASSHPLPRPTKEGYV